MKEVLREDATLVDAGNHDGLTSLMASSRENQSCFADYLLRSGGAKLSLTDGHGNTTLHLAAGTGSLKATTVILKYIHENRSLNKVIDYCNRDVETALVLC